MTISGDYTATNLEYKGGLVNVKVGRLVIHKDDEHIKDQLEVHIFSLVLEQLVTVFIIVSVKYLTLSAIVIKPIGIITEQIEQTSSGKADLT